MHSHPETVLLGMSGTITKRSLHDFAHILEWALGKRRMPLPASNRDLDEWARAVDVDKNGFRPRVPPGALHVLYGEMETTVAKLEPLRAARVAVRRRIKETAGVVSSEEGDDVDSSLNITVRAVEGYDKRIVELFHQMNNGVLPNGDPITDATLGVRWGKCRELTSGFYYEWDPRPPDAWIAARRTWKQSAAEVLDRHLSGLESEGTIASIVLRAGANGLNKLGVGKDLAQDTAKAQEAWQRIRNSFKPNIVPRWECDRMVNEIAKWADNHKGLIWISEVALGQRLEKEGIVPYYANQGLDAKKRFVEDAKKKGGSIALSIASNSEGRNLQHEWSENLMVSCPPTGTTWEQCMGRTHRPGQPEDEVDFETLIGCSVEHQCWVQANDDAVYAGLDGRKKLTYCSKTVEEMPWGSNALWRKNTL